MWRREVNGSNSGFILKEECRAKVDSVATTLGTDINISPKYQKGSFQSRTPQALTLDGKFKEREFFPLPSAHLPFFLLRA
jgi:hypothetical protein